MIKLVDVSFAFAIVFPWGVAGAAWATVFVILVMNNVIVAVGTQSKYGSEIPLAVIDITMKLCMVVAQIALGIAIGAQPIYGYNYGNGQYDRVKKTFKLAIIGSTIVLVLAFFAFEFFPEPIIGLFAYFFNPLERQCRQQYYLFCVRLYC